MRTNATLAIGLVSVCGLLMGCENNSYNRDNRQGMYDGRDGSNRNSSYYNRGDSLNRGGYVNRTTGTSAYIQHQNTGYPGYRFGQENVNWRDRLDQRDYDQNRSQYGDSNRYDQNQYDQNNWNQNRSQYGSTGQYNQGQYDQGQYNQGQYNQNRNDDNRYDHNRYDQNNWNQNRRDQQNSWNPDGMNSTTGQYSDRNSGNPGASSWNDTDRSWNRNDARFTPGNGQWDNQDRGQDNRSDWNQPNRSSNVDRNWNNQSDDQSRGEGRYPTAYPVDAFRDNWETTNTGVSVFSDQIPRPVYDTLQRYSDGGVVRNAIRTNWRGRTVYEIPTNVNGEMFKLWIDENGRLLSMRQQEGR